MKKTKIPKFKTEEEEAKFWDTHDTTEFMDELREVRNIKFPKPRKRLVSMRVNDTMIKSLKEVAASKGIGYLTLMRMWIAERLSREHRIAHPRHN